MLMRTEIVYRLRGATRLPFETLAPAQPQPTRSDTEVLNEAFRVYLPDNADVVVGDQLEIRGVAYRLIEVPALRLGFALVLDVERVAADLGSFGCAVTIGPAGAAVFNSVDRVTTTADVVPVYVGPASIDPVSTSDGRTVESAGDQVDDRAYRIGLPAGTGDLVEVEHIVHVTAAPNADLVGRRLYVTSIARPGRETQHEVIAHLYE
jgi:hypothetical protein